MGFWRGLQTYLSRHRFAVKNRLRERWGRASFPQQICRKTWVAGKVGFQRGVQPHLSRTRLAVKNGLRERWGRAGGFGDPAPHLSRNRFAVKRGLRERWGGVRVWALKLYKPNSLRGGTPPLGWHGFRILVRTSSQTPKGTWPMEF